MIIKLFLKLSRYLVNLLLFVPILKILKLKLSYMPPRFGQLLLHIDIFLAEYDYGMIDRKIYFLVPVIPYNKYLFEKWKSKPQINIVPHRYSSILLKMMDCDLLFKHNCYHQTNDNDPNGILVNSKINIDIKDNEIKRFEDTYKFDLRNTKYITTTVRDIAYHKSINSVGGTVYTQNYRNSILEDYEKTFSHLNDLGYKVLITGRFGERKNIPNTLYFGNLKNEVDDFIVSLFSEFHLSIGGTGYDQVPVSLKKPIVATCRTLPFFCSFYPYEIYNLKHYYSLTDNRYLTLDEICKTYILYDSDVIEKNIKFIDPQADEINAMLDEWLLRKKDTFKDNNLVRNQRSQFLSNFPSNTLNLGTLGNEKVHSERPYAVLASSYIKKNMQLINPKEVK